MFPILGFVYFLYLSVFIILTGKRKTCWGGGGFLLLAFSVFGVTKCYCKLFILLL